MPGRQLTEVLALLRTPKHSAHRDTPTRAVH